MNFSPKLNILPEPQRAIWTELSATPKEFVLYGGTALSLRLGHRVSEDFDFFTNETFGPEDLLKRIPYLQGGKVVLLRENTFDMSPGSKRFGPRVILRRTRAQSSSRSGHGAR